jgi:hypothetical protein
MTLRTYKPHKGAFAKRHYDAIAGVLRNELKWASVLSGSGPIRGITAVEDALVALFEADNPNFKPEKFRAAVRKAP